MKKQILLILVIFLCTVTPVWAQSVSITNVPPDTLTPETDTILLDYQIMINGTQQSSLIFIANYTSSSLELIDVFVTNNEVEIGEQCTVQQTSQQLIVKIESMVPSNGLVTLTLELSVDESTILESKIVCIGFPEPPNLPLTRTRTITTQIQVQETEATIDPEPPIIDTEPQDNQHPYAVFTTIGDLTVNNPIEFDASSSYDPEDDALSYTWSLGDGFTLFGEKISHVYTQSGTYTITLTVEDPQSQKSSTTKQITIKPEQTASLTNQTTAQEKHTKPTPSNQTTITQPPIEEIEYSNLEIQQTKDTVTVKVTIKNNTNKTTTETAILKIDMNQYYPEKITLEPYEEKTITYEIEAPLGTHNIRIGSQQTDITINETQNQIPQPILPILIGFLLLLIYKKVGVRINSML